ncbi:stage V sporulation protein D [Turicibacter sanguinis]|nr:stage V sporulation protein D [Turicibacter sanguinis]MTH09923.1 stage V sporulation protein D [Turicibacter sanguinis]MTH13303.1 stage V sporulation protein D [Turicibacter sanguinis]MTH20285.1 stage V sporulation protein D [Turicibacter sanguinis]MTH41233.1 stage V sporulation protein D [Turicibacter sanguinis]
MKQAGVIQRRLLIFLSIVLIYFIALFIRLGYLQIFDSNELVQKAEELWSRNLPIEGQRGIIYDRNHEVIVGNEVAPSVIVIPRQVTDVEHTSEVLAEILGVSVEEANRHVTNRVSVERIQPEGRKLSNEQVVAIQEANLDGVYLVNDVKRSYPYGSLLAQTIGFTGIDNQGITGLEYVYNDYLMGANGVWQYFSDAKGNPLPQFSDSYSPASRGLDIELTIDLHLQQILDREFDNAVAKYDPDQMIGIIMDPKTGEILALSSRPTYEPENYQDYDQEIFNRNLPIWSTYEPGSTFKIVTFSAALEEGVMTLEDRFFDPGYAMVDGVRIRDWKAGGHGDQSMLEVIMNSCNPGFIELGMRLGKEKLFEYIKAYGFNEKTGVDMLGESQGIIFNPDNIGNVELATSSFGQGNSVTPIQLVTAVSAAVNGGNLMQPYIVKRMIHPYTNEILYERQPTIKRQVISQETSDTMRYALEMVGAQGSGKGAYIDGYRVGGKTGTAQKARNGAYVSGEYILSFVGIAPMDDPQLVVYVAIDNPKNTIQYGGVVAAPIARSILAEALPYIGVEPREEQIEKKYNWLDTQYVTIPDFVGQEKKNIETSYLYNIEYYGEGTKVISQQPEAYTRTIEGGTIRLYLGE